MVKDRFGVDEHFRISCDTCKMEANTVTREQAEYAVERHDIKNKGHVHHIESLDDIKENK